MIKKLLTVIVSLFMVMGIFVTNVYAADPKTVGELLGMAENSFPTSLEDAWVDGAGNSLFISNDHLCIQYDGDQNPTEIIGLDVSVPFTWIYHIEDTDYNLYFSLENDDSGVLFQIEYDIYEPYYHCYQFGPAITVQEYFGDTFSSLPDNFNDAWTNYAGVYLYIANNALGVYDSDNTLLDSIPLNSKTPSFAYDLYTPNGNRFSVTFTVEGNIENIYFELVDEFDTYFYPRCFVMDILPSDFPSYYVPWSNDNDAFIFLSDFEDFNPNEVYFNFAYDDYENFYEDRISLPLSEITLTPGVNNYTSTLVTDSSGDEITLTFNLDSNGITDNLNIDGFTGEYVIFNGTYVVPPPLYVSEIISQSKAQFPTSRLSGWTDGYEDYVYISNNKLVISLPFGDTKYVSLDKLAKLDLREPGRDSYRTVTDDGLTVYFDFNNMNFDTIALEYEEFNYIVMSPLSIDTFVTDDFPYEWYGSEYYWIDGTGNVLYITSMNSRFKLSNFDDSVSFVTYCDPQNTLLNKTSDHTYEGHDVVCDTSSGFYLPTDDDISYILITNESGEVVKINVTVEGEFSSLSGTYEQPKTVRDVLKLSDYVFPSLKEKGWKIGGGDPSLYLTDSGELKFNDLQILDNVNSCPVLINGSNYKYNAGGMEITFNMTNYFLRNITIANGTGEFVDANGTYYPLAPNEYEEAIIVTNPVFDPSDNENAIFKSNVNYSLFYNSDLDIIIGKVYVDDKYVSQYYYDSFEGSTYIELYNTYLRELSDGPHTLRIAFADGYADATFTIVSSGNDPSPGRHIVINTGVN